MFIHSVSVVWFYEYTINLKLTGICCRKLAVISGHHIAKRTWKYSIQIWYVDGCYTCVCFQSLIFQWIYDLKKFRENITYIWPSQQLFLYKSGTTAPHQGNNFLTFCYHLIYVFFLYWPFPQADYILYFYYFQFSTHNLIKDIL
jgi:hypothetical protein